MTLLNPLRFGDYNILTMTTVPLTIPNLGYRFSMITIFIVLYFFQKGVKFWVLLLEINFFYEVLDVITYQKKL